jgi:hypothetical protein
MYIFATVYQIKIDGYRRNKIFCIKRRMEKMASK